MIELVEVSISSDQRIGGLHQVGSWASNLVSVLSEQLVSFLLDVGHQDGSLVLNLLFLEIIIKIRNLTYAQVWENSNHNLTGWVDELFDKSSTLSPGDHTVTVDVVFLEESVELRDGSLWLASVGEDLIEHLEALSFVEETVPVEIVFGKDLVGKLCDWISNLWCGQVSFDELSHLRS